MLPAGTVVNNSGLLHTTAVQVDLEPRITSPAVALPSRLAVRAIRHTLTGRQCGLSPCRSGGGRRRRRGWWFRPWARRFLLTFNAVQIPVTAPLAGSVHSIARILNTLSFLRITVFQGIELTHVVQVAAVPIVGETAVRQPCFGHNRDILVIVTKDVKRRHRLVALRGVRHAAIACNEIALHTLELQANEVTSALNCSRSSVLATSLRRKVIRSCGAIVAESFRQLRVAP
mmetsp:Transcript_71600/g.164078  ORF Transcript_71600/g.164078 Transcript_71600/m.164078 type:complete len:230 (-) Transcript_71600:2236-2925(-)